MKRIREEIQTKLNELLNKWHQFFYLVSQLSK